MKNWQIVGSSLMTLAPQSKIVGVAVHVKDLSFQTNYDVIAIGAAAQGWISQRVRTSLISS